MNKQLYDSYKKLNETARSETRFRLKDSPVGLLLIDFLEKCSNRNFKNREVVEYIYSAELDKAPYPVLENRYFKLRKKITDEYLQEKNDTSEYLPEEEKELNRCRQLIRENDKETAFQRLAALEKLCWEKNIFELLPSIIDQLLFCNQSFNRLDRNAHLYDRLEKAIALQADNNRVSLLARKIYEINFTKGMKFAKKEMDLLKDLAVKHKSYPRFAMCYHHVALYYKLGSIDYVNDMQVISRHYSQFTKMFEKHPLMPLVGYRVNYSQYQHFHFKQIAVFYHFNRCEFDEAYLAMKVMWEMVQDGIFRIYKTESIFFNMINAQVAAGHYQEADALTDEFMAFLKENGQSEKMAYAYTQKALVWCAAWPRLKNVNVELLMSRINDYQKLARKSDNIQISYAETEALKAKMYFLLKDIPRALEILEGEEGHKFLEKLGIHEVFLKFFRSCDSRLPAAERKVMKEEAKKEISAIKFRSKSPAVILQLNWLSRMALES